MSLPAPYPATTRAKGWRFELDYEKIGQSDTWSIAAEVPMSQPALLMMWFVAWTQEPCGSLPNDENVIRAKCHVPVKVWPSMRDVLMRGWCLADDGRLYHPTITARVLEMIEYRVKTADRVAKFKLTQREQHGGNALPPVKNDTGTGTGTGTGTKKRKEKRGDTPLKPPAAWAPPSWLPIESWAAFAKHRKAMRGVPFTEEARDGVIRELEKLRATHDPAELLQTAVTRGWRTVFAPRQNGHTSVDFVSKQEQIEAHNSRVGDEWLRQEAERDATH